MKLGELLAGVEVLEWHAPAELEIGGVSYDSRETAPGRLVCRYDRLCGRWARFHSRSAKEGRGVHVV